MHQPALHPLLHPPIRIFLTPRHFPPPLSRLQSSPIIRGTDRNLLHVRLLTATYAAKQRTINDHINICEPNYRCQCGMQQPHQTVRHKTKCITTHESTHLLLANMSTQNQPIGTRGGARNRTVQISHNCTLLVHSLLYSLLVAAHGYVNVC